MTHRLILGCAFLLSLAATSWTNPVWAQDRPQAVAPTVEVMRAQATTAGGPVAQRAAVSLALPSLSAGAGFAQTVIAAPTGAVGFPKDNPGFSTGFSTREPVLLRDPTYRGGGFDPSALGLNMATAQSPGRPFDPDGIGINADVPVMSPLLPLPFNPSVGGTALAVRPTSMLGVQSMFASADFSPVKTVSPISAAGPAMPNFDQAVIAALSVQNGVFDAGKGEQFGRQFGEAVRAYNEKLEEYRKEQVQKLQIEDTIRMLSPQVLIKARIIQVNRSHLTDVGTVLDYISQNPASTNRPSFFTSNGVVKQRNLELKANFPVPLGVNGGATLQLTSKRIDALITAIQQDFRIDTLAAPQLTALNDELVNFTAGVSLPFFYGRNATLDSSNRTQEVFFKHVGVQLSVVPHVLTRQEVAEAFDSTSEGQNLSFLVNTARINPTQYQAQRQCLIDQASAGQPIVLTIAYRVSDPGTSTFTTTKDGVDITVNAEQAVRAGTSRVRIRNGCGIVIGGLINEAATDTVVKVPVLGDIPLVGNAFRRKTRTRDKFETLIFVEARLVGMDDPAADHYEYADRHVPGGPVPGAPHAPFSQIPLTPLEGHVHPVPPGEPLRDKLLRPVSTAIEIVR